MNASYLKACIARMFRNRHNCGAEVCGMPLYEHWYWHRQYRAEIRQLVAELRGRACRDPGFIAATPEQFARDNPGCIL